MRGKVCELQRKMLDKEWVLALRGLAAHVVQESRRQAQHCMELLSSVKKVLALLNLFVLEVKLQIHRGYEAREGGVILLAESVLSPVREWEVPGSVAQKE